MCNVSRLWRVDILILVLIFGHAFAIVIARRAIPETVSSFILMPPAELVFQPYRLRTARQYVHPDTLRQGQCDGDQCLLLLPPTSQQRGLVIIFCISLQTDISRMFRFEISPANLFEAIKSREPIFLAYFRNPCSSNCCCIAMFDNLNLFQNASPSACKYADVNLL